MTAIIGGVTLTDNCVWINEFDGSKVKNTVKHTEDGRRFVFQHIDSLRDAEMKVKDSVDYQTMVDLTALLNAGDVVNILFDDGQSFNVIINSIEGLPFFEDNIKDFYHLVLNLIEI